MPLFLDTRGNRTAAVALCDRCHKKFPYDELMPDLQNPALRVCKDDRDSRSVYELPPRKTEIITLRYPRPEEELK